MIFKKEVIVPWNVCFENGLIVKPIIKPKFQIVKSDLNEELNIYITITKKDLQVIKLIEVIQYKLFNNNEFWLILNNCYIVLYNFNQEIKQNIKNTKLIFCFYNEKQEFLEGFELE